MSTPTGPRVAIFVRVSKVTQNYERQINDLQALALRNAWQVVAVIQEKGSATKRKNIERPELDQLMALARSRQIDKVLVTESSRLGRRPGEMSLLLEELIALGVSVYAQNVGIETLTPEGKRSFAAMLMLAINAERDAEEAERTSERSRSGVVTARAKGVHIGRKPGSTKTDDDTLAKYPDVVRQLRAGKSNRDVADITGKSRATVEKVRAILFPKLAVNPNIPAGTLAKAQQAVAKVMNRYPVLEE